MKKQEELNKKLKSVIVSEFGAKESDQTNIFESVYKFETDGGFYLMQFPKPDGNSEILSIFGRFLNVQKANEKLGKNFGHNVFNGKYNFHFTKKGVNVDGLVKTIKEIFSKIV